MKYPIRSLQSVSKGICLPERMPSPPAKMRSAAKSRTKTIKYPVKPRILLTKVPIVSPNGPIKTPSPNWIEASEGPSSRAEARVKMPNISWARRDLAEGCAALASFLGASTLTTGFLVVFFVFFLLAKAIPPLHGYAYILLQNTTSYYLIAPSSIDRKSPHRVEDGVAGAIGTSYPSARFDPQHLQLILR